MFLLAKKLDSAPSGNVESVSQAMFEKDVALGGGRLGQRSDKSIADFYLVNFALNACNKQERLTDSASALSLRIHLLFLKGITRQHGSASMNIGFTEANCAGSGRRRYSG